MRRPAGAKRPADIGNISCYLKKKVGHRCRRNRTAPPPSCCRESRRAGVQHGRRGSRDGGMRRRVAPGAVEVKHGLDSRSRGRRVCCASGEQRNKGAGRPRRAAAEHAEQRQRRPLQSWCCWRLHCAHAPRIWSTGYAHQHSQRQGEGWAGGGQLGGKVTAAGRGKAAATGALSRNPRPTPSHPGGPMQACL